MGITYMALSGYDHTRISCFDSLDKSAWTDEWSDLASTGFDIIMTNPPFGTKIAITNKEILNNFLLAHKWEYSKVDGAWKATDKLLNKQDPQVLFIERCVQLLKPSGKFGIVLPEGIVGNKQSAYILDYLRAEGQIFAIIDAPRTLFQPSTDIKTVLLFFQKRCSTKESLDRDLFMAEIRHCGHDRRGKTIFDDGGNVLNVRV